MTDTKRVPNPTPQATDAKMPPRLSVWQDDSGKLFASAREKYSRDIFDYDKQNGTFEYISRQEAEAMLSQARAEAKREALEGVAKTFREEAKRLASIEIENDSTARNAIATSIKKASIMHQTGAAIHCEFLAKAAAPTKEET